MKIKICGMKYPDNILEVGNLLPDYLGFIFYEKSARFFEGQMPILPKSIQKVGVFVNASFEYIMSNIKKYNLDIVQLHGDEDTEFCKNLQKENIPIIKVFSIDDNFDFTIIQSFENYCNYFLFDTKGKLPGGNGVTFNWDLLQQYSSTKPFFLSGGIDIEDINKIVKLKLPIHAIDINSKFEIQPGLKNTLLCNHAITSLRKQTSLL